MIRKFIFLAMWIFATTADAGLINSIEDLKAYNQFHSERVEVLILNIYRRFYFKTPGLTLSIVKGFKHDPRKNEPENLQASFALFGIPIDTPELVKRKEALILQINKDEYQDALEYFDQVGILNPDNSLTLAANVLLRIEMMSDYIDRYKNPLSVEEFARKTYPASTMEILTEDERRIAGIVEDEYFELVNGFLYTDRRHKEGATCEPYLVRSNSL